MRPITALLAVVVCVVVFTPNFALAVERSVGVGSIDITPDYPVRLSGFGFRRTESEGVTQRIYAKAMAIADGKDVSAVLITVDNLGVSDAITQEIAKRLAEKRNFDPSRLTITSTHTHTAPMLSGVVQTLFGRPITADEQSRIDRYTRELSDNLEKVALSALSDLKPAKLQYAVGSVDFAINRRTKGGPVDHDLPVMIARSPGDNMIRAIYVSYACHCVTLATNKVSGDWAGYVQELVEKNHAGAVALVSVGCGADSNPSKRDTPEIAGQQGKQIADEIDRLISHPMTDLTEPLATKYNRITLPFDKPPTREELEVKAAKGGEYVDYFAKVQLAKLDRGEKLQAEISYPIQTWTFGNQLAMVFLPGEVVVDYSLRLKREFDRSRIWTNAYCNDVPCYIPSERILKEGGYEGGGAMIFYNRPTRLATGVEKKIIDEIHAQLPDTFQAPKGTEGTAPRSAQDSLKTIHVRPGLEVELVASEPLVTSPVAIDWGADGKLWVCEMYDYPTGADQNWQPGGRVKFLEDTDHDGRYNKATVFLENLPFPTGVTVWGDGVLVCAAPDVLFARDTDGDGKADKIETLYTGFATGNYQARVNSLTIGLDNWIYGANGLLGGEISGKGINGKLDIRNRDFRIRSLNGPMETVTGLTQQGRVRDDWGNWFGCDNSRSLRYYPHEQHYLQRNTSIPSPDPVMHPPGEKDPVRIYPLSRTLERFNGVGTENQFTSGCGLDIYRDTYLGSEYYGNAFTCEPVHNLVHRAIIESEGGTLKRKRSEDERESEFLASSDNWFRPVQVRTGPDGALYVVDMYRFLIEHPRWIPAERLAKIDARAGSDMGRIYRVKLNGNPLGPVSDLTKFSGAQLAEALNSTSGTERDRVHIALLTRRDPSSHEPLKKLVKSHPLPQVRVQALAVLDGLGALSVDDARVALKDSSDQVRKQAVRLAETRFSEDIIPLVNDPSPIVRQQLAFSLGESKSPEAAKALAQLARARASDVDIRIAALSSASVHNCGELLMTAVTSLEDKSVRSAWLAPLVATATASKDPALLARAMSAVLPDGQEIGVEQFTALASILDALDAKQSAPQDARVDQAIESARKIAADESAKVDSRAAATGLLGRGKTSDAETDLLCKLAGSATAPPVRGAALEALRRQTNPIVAEKLLANWRQTSPGARADIINLLLSRGEWTVPMLAAVKRDVVRSHEISLADRQRLTGSEVAEIRTLATELFPLQPKGDRAATIKKYVDAAAAKAGVAANGTEVFAQNCAACHALNGVGHDVGPNLVALRDKDAAYFIQNILDPGAIIEPRFANYQVLLKDRRVLSGLITSDTPAGITLVGGNGATENVARSAIKEMRVAEISMMPEGLDGAISPDQMADLIAFLKSGAGAPKKFPGNEPKTIKVARDGSYLLPATAAAISGDRIMFETEFNNVGYWHAAGDQAAWTLNVKSEGEFDVHLDYACDDDSAGNEFVVESGGGASVRGVVAKTGPDWSQYKQAKVGTVHLQAGEQRVVVRSGGKITGALMDLRAVALVPAGKAFTWPARPILPANPDADLARDPAAVTRVILDAKRTREAREAAVNANPQFAPELIANMTADLPPATSKLEYDRIPWIWRVSIACAKRNVASDIKTMLAVSLPEVGAPLRDWQAVVIGGGVINGISLRGMWPADRVKEILADDAKLQARWDYAIEKSSSMADDAKVFTGTRYDALRMLGVLPWDKCGAQLVRYLDDKTAELQMGAVSGIADVNDEKAKAALVKALPKLTDSNRKLAEESLRLRESRSK